MYIEGRGKVKKGLLLYVRLKMHYTEMLALLTVHHDIRTVYTMLKWRVLVCQIENATS